MRMDEHKTHQCTVWANVGPLVLLQTVHKTKEFGEFGETTYHYWITKGMSGFLPSVVPSGIFTAHR